TTLRPQCKPRENVRDAIFPPASAKEITHRRTPNDRRHTFLRQWDGRTNRQRYFYKIPHRLAACAGIARNRFPVQTGVDSQRRSPPLPRARQHVHAPRESTQRVPCAALPWWARAPAALSAPVIALQQPL